MHPTNRFDYRTAKRDIALRVQLVREDRFGADGVESLAQIMGIPALTWENYEQGVTIPAEVLLVFIEICGVSPSWLLNGKGERYSR